MGCWCRSQAIIGMCVGGWNKGIEQLVSVNADTSKAEAGEICRESVTTMLAIDSFLGGESCWA